MEHESKPPLLQNEFQKRRNGRTRSGSQQHRCGTRGRRYISEPKQAGYSGEMRLQAVRMYADGMSLHQVFRHLGVRGILRPNQAAELHGYVLSAYVQSLTFG